MTVKTCNYGRSKKIKKLIENVEVRLGQVLREMRLLVVLLGGLGVLFSCGAAADSGSGVVLPDFSANDVLELRVSGEVTIPSGTYISIVEGGATTDIRGVACSDTYIPPVLKVYEGTTLSSYITAVTPAVISPYVDRTNTANDTNAVTVAVSNGSGELTTFSFNYIVSCEASDLAGDGNSARPYEIASASALNLVAELVDTDSAFRGSHYRVTADIDLGVAGAPWAESSAGAGFNPIGEGPDIGLRGSFDCADNTLSNLFINRGGSNEIGLIGVLGNGGSVMNCVLENIKITGQHRVGGLVGIAFYGSISHSTVTGTIIGARNAVGGLIGVASNGSISGSTVTGAVTGSGTGVGGLMGSQSGGSVRDSTAAVTVRGLAEGNIGGLVGSKIGGSISDSMATGAVTASGTNTLGLMTGGDNVGGLVGFDSSGSISGSMATGNVTGSSNNVGGLVGFQNATSISNSIATGDVTGSRNYVGGLVGRSAGSISNSTATGNVNGPSHVGGLIGTFSTNETLANVYSRGAVSGNSVTGGLIGSVGNVALNIVNSYTVSTGGHYSFIGSFSNSNTLRVMNSYAGGTSTNNALAPSTVSGLSQQSRDELKEGIGLYNGWNTTVWDFGTDSQLPVLIPTPDEHTTDQVRD